MLDINYLLYKGNDFLQYMQEINQIFLMIKLNKVNNVNCK